MRSTIQKLVQRLDSVRRFPEPICEFGAFQVPGHERRAGRPLFSGRRYIGSDLQRGPGVDCVLDLERLGLRTEAVGTAIALDTLEHVEQVWIALEELHRVLKPGGLLLLTSVMYFPTHAWPDDYWRFTASGFRALARKFDLTIIETAGLSDLPHTVVALAVKGRIDPSVEEALRAALADWKRNDAQGWRELFSLVLPPIVLAPAYRWYARVVSARRARS